jgi:hypothetical protein
LELNLWYADDGTLVGSIAEVAKAYQILKDDGPWMPSHLKLQQHHSALNGRTAFDVCVTCKQLEVKGLTKTQKSWCSCGLHVNPTYVVNEQNSQQAALSVSTMNS